MFFATFIPFVPVLARSAIAVAVHVDTAASRGALGSGFPAFPPRPAATFVAGFLSSADAVGTCRFGIFRVNINRFFKVLYFRNTRLHSHLKK